jgi:hypothetical protein
MRRELLPSDLTRQVTPRALKGYAAGLDWKPVEGVNGDVAVYHRPDSRAHQVIIPVDTTLSDYDEAVAEAVRKLADYERRPASEVLEHLLLPPADLLGFREVSPDAETGSLPLEHAVRLINGTRKLLLSAAHSALVPLAYHPRLSRSEAEEFVNRCRLGQTDRGSFVVNVACPLDEQLTFSESEEPFGRRVTSLLLDALDTLARAADEGVKDDLIDPARRRGVSANLCESLLMLRPSGDRASLSVSATWSRTRLPSSRIKDRRVELRQEAFSVAEALAPRLRTISKPRSSRFFGFVGALVGQPTQTDPRPSGEVRFRLFDQDEELPARADLAADEYAVAGAAHLAGDLVSFRGILHRLPRLNRIEQVAQFERIRLDEDGLPEEMTAHAEPTT